MYGFLARAPRWEGVVHEGEGWELEGTIVGAALSQGLPFGCKDGCPLCPLSLDPLHCPLCLCLTCHGMSLSDYSLL